MTTILELRGITKAFPGVLANDHIDLQLEQGGILALLGENGAGKTTLMNILYGLYKPDEGEIIGPRPEGRNPWTERCHRAWHRHGASTFHANTGHDCDRKRHAGRRADPQRNHPRQS